MNKLIIFLSLIILLGCAPSVQITKFGPLPDVPKIGEIDVYTSTVSIQKPYKEIALITVDDEGHGRSETELLEILISKAKEIGADGLIILGQDKQHEWSTFIAGTFYSSYKRIVRGSAIIYVNP